MVHHRQRLPLGLEPRDDALGVHAQLDDLERNAAAERLLLFGHVNHAAAALADLLEQFVAADFVARLFGHRKGQDDGGAAGVRRGFIHEATGLFVRFKQALDPPAQIVVTGTGLPEVFPALVRRQLRRGVENRFVTVGWFVHA